ncbi:MAG: hypothetical protein PV344_02265, partial [Anaplasma sp.]|nr:hypothetical protein [Anaplasma sp.]
RKILRRSVRDFFDDFAVVEAAPVAVFQIDLQVLAHVHANCLEAPFIVRAISKKGSKRARVASVSRSEWEANEGLDIVKLKSR